MAKREQEKKDGKPEGEEGEGERERGRAPEERRFAKILLPKIYILNVDAGERVKGPACLPKLKSG